MTKKCCHICGEIHPDEPWFRIGDPFRRFHLPMLPKNEKGKPMMGTYEIVFGTLLKFLFTRVSLIGNDLTLRIIFLERYSISFGLGSMPSNAQISRTVVNEAVEETSDVLDSMLERLKQTKPTDRGDYSIN